MCIFDKQPPTLALSLERKKVTITENYMYINMLQFYYEFITVLDNRLPGATMCPIVQPKVDPWLPDRATKIVDQRLCN